MIPHIHFFLIASVMLHLFFKFQDILQCKNLCESYVEIKYTQTTLLMHASHDDVPEKS